MPPARELPRLEFYARALKVEISVKYMFSLCMPLQYTFSFSFFLFGYQKRTISPPTKRKKQRNKQKTKKGGWAGRKTSNKLLTEKHNNTPLFPQKQKFLVLSLCKQSRDYYYSFVYCSMSFGWFPPSPPPPTSCFQPQVLSLFPPYQSSDGD